ISCPCGLQALARRLQQEARRAPRRNLEERPMRIQKTQSGSHRHILRRVGGLKALSVALLVSLPACGSYEGDTDLGDDLSQVEQDLFADSSWLFMPTGTSSTTQIAMCWTSSAFGSGANAAKFQTRRQVTEQAIADTWEAHSWINVTW